MYATVRLPLVDRKGVLTIPIQSLTNGDKPSVLIVKDNKIEKRDVTVGLETPDRAEIQDGLEEGDLVVVGNRGSLQAGQPAMAREMSRDNP